MTDFEIQESSFGSLFFVGVNGTALSEQERSALKTLRPIGFLPFAKNFRQGVSYREWLSSFKSLVEDFSACTGHEKILVAIDHEGGRVIRTPKPTTCFPYPFYWKDSVREISTAMAEELRSIGVNLSFSPSLDIHSNPKNPVIGPRAFGTTPKEVADKGKLAVEALLKAGIIPCAKHFPGHGDTSTDSHFGLPRLSLPLEQIKAREILPFIQLVGFNVPVIMTAHVLFDTIDRDNPATLSAAILTKLLREELLFKGVVVSDSLYMHAVHDRFKQQAGIIDSFNAGCDMFIASDFKQGENLSFALKLASDLVAGVSSKKISLERVKVATDRVTKLMSLARKPEFSELDPSIFTAHAELAKSLNVNPEEVRASFGVELYPPHREP